MEKIDQIKQDREGRFWEERMKNSEHHKKEMIKSNLIRNQTLIGDVEIRKKVDELKEKRDEKRRLRSQRHIKRLNIGLNDEMQVDEPTDNFVKLENKKNSKKRNKKHAVPMKKKLLNNNNIDMSD
jgi:hypothetical protein